MKFNAHEKLMKSSQKCFSWILHGSRFGRHDKQNKRTPIEKITQPDIETRNLKPYGVKMFKKVISDQVSNSNKPITLNSDEIKKEQSDKIEVHYLQAITKKNNIASTLLSLLTQKLIECFYKSLFDELIDNKVSLHQDLQQVQKELSPPISVLSHDNIYTVAKQKYGMPHNISSTSYYPQNLHFHQTDHEWQNTTETSFSLLNDSIHLKSERKSELQQINWTISRLIPKYFYQVENQTLSELQSSAYNRATGDNANDIRTNEEYYNITSMMNSSKNKQTSPPLVVQTLSHKERASTFYQSKEVPQNNNDFLSKNSYTTTKYHQENEKLADIESQLYESKKMMELYAKNETSYYNTKKSTSVVGSLGSNFSLNKLMSQKYQQKAKFGRLSFGNELKERLRRMRTEKLLYLSLRHYKNKFHSPSIKFDHVKDNLTQLHRLLNRYHKENDQFSKLNRTTEIKTQLISINLMEKRLKSVGNFLHQLHRHLKNDPNIGSFNNFARQKNATDHENFNTQTTAYYDSTLSKHDNEKSKLSILYTRQFHDKNIKSQLEKILPVISNNSKGREATEAISSNTAESPAPYLQPKNSQQDKNAHRESLLADIHRPSKSLEDVENELRRQLQLVQLQKERLLKEDTNESCDFDGERRIYLALFRRLSEDEYGQVRQTIQVQNTLNEF